MKLITLNTWGGRLHDALLDFFKTHQDVDVFCLQEIYSKCDDEEITMGSLPATLDIYSEIQSVLPNYTGYFRPQVDGCYGLAIFIKKEITVSDEGEISIYNPEDHPGGTDNPRSMQYISFVYNDKPVLVGNVHGHWTGTGKLDTPERLQQSRIIRSFLDARSESKILCGDFNLEPQTESVALLASGYKDLIKEYGILSTRTDYCKWEVRYADYIFCAPDVSVNTFKVLPDVVSDHSPLLLEF